MRAGDSSRGLSSPSSMNDIDSVNGSPDTKLTVYSPEETITRGRLDTRVIDTLSDSGIRRLCSTASSDPFFVSAASTRVQLSPTAAAFTPVGTSDSTSVETQTRTCPRSFAQIDFLAPHLESKRNETSPGLINRMERENLSYGAFGSIQSTRIKQLFGAEPDDLDKEGHSRALVIENVPNNLTYMSLAGFFNRREFGSLRGPVLSELNSNGKVYVAFTDSREVTKAIEKVNLLRPEWRAFPITAKEYVRHAEPFLLSQASDYEGQLLVTVYFDGRNPDLNQHTVARSLETLAMTFGDIKSFTNVPTGQDNIGEFHIEFFNTRDAENVTTTLNGTLVDDCIIEIKQFKPDVEQRACRLISASPNPAKERLAGTETHFNPNASWAATQSCRTPYMELSPTGRSTVPPGEHTSLMSWMSRAGERVIPSLRRDLNRYPDPRMGSQNSVDIERIRLGLDVRTTIMLRNIPNKIDQTMLKAIVDETSHGKYDFMYLRIDFANNCNVGYAFINFEDPIDIIDFVNTRAGRTWNCFNSDKVAEVSYATIQGKDCLVQKFRNSSVMLEHPSFRPKIFHTGTGPLAGTEDRFPGPDNPSKMRRSIENAEHVGLFAPRVGQQYRDEQRRRRSQFDRGTTAAEREVVFVRTLAPKRTYGASNGLRSAPCTYPGVKSWYDSPMPENIPKTS
ncbi:putative meiosis protein MEI2 [Aspergillus homomorphus CBS 101889]|uniref:Meiosis protein MEI2 n=1 Tax=Aspergillus homomorphus (strain CBS 101889) TaxID=1450537 RepID=A0A395HIX5_ASPHC|nr:meiosis protein MEI2 [Aspergillus homomorphus CBS 101889]RAL07720.1 meiosis protein MEI2 [Aspergillus homomorphus CBS 101889]